MPGMCRRSNHFGARTRRGARRISTQQRTSITWSRPPFGFDQERGLRSRTYATLFALLSATGLRISEALKLTVADVTCDGLLIRGHEIHESPPGAAARRYGVQRATAAIWRVI